MFDVTGAETATLAASFGLQAVFEARRPSQRQPGIDWTRLVLRKTGDKAMDSFSAS